MYPIGCPQKNVDKSFQPNFPSEYHMTSCNIVNISWPCNSVVESKRVENAMRPVLHRKGEWGRGRNKAGNRHGMTLYQALSLRRGLLRWFNRAKFHQSSPMGSDRGQQDVATLFEDAVVSYLRSSLGTSPGIFLTEKEFLAEMRAGKRYRGPTPDVLFLKPVKINGVLVSWLDAKQYYASAILAHKEAIPNGKLKNQALRYNEKYGLGAFVFARGFCAEPSFVVENALLLDATPLDMCAIEAYQDAS